MKKNQSLFNKIQALSDFLRPMNIPLHSAHTGFFLILSIFPALLLLLGLLGYTDLGVADLLDFLSVILPDSLMPYVKRLIETCYGHTSGTVVSVSVVATLWSASRGTYGLLSGFRDVYGLKKGASYWRSRGLSVAYTFLFLVALVATLVIHVFGSIILDYLWMTTDPVIMWLLNAVDLQFFMLLILQTVLFSAMYVLIPGTPHRLWACLPGALLGSLGWSVYSRLFSVYVSYFTDYYNIFGSIYALALGLLWLYFCICILFYGGALNRYMIERRQKHESSAKAA